MSNRKSEVLHKKWFYRLIGGIVVTAVGVSGSGVKATVLADTPTVTINNVYMPPPTSGQIGCTADVATTAYVSLYYKIDVIGPQVTTPLKP